MHLDEGIRGEPGTTGRSVEQGRIGTGHRTRRVSGQTFRELTNLIDPNDLNTYFHRWLIRWPGQLPLKIGIEHDEESKDLVLRAVEAIEETAKQFGVSEFVEIVQKKADPGERRQSSLF